MGRLDRTSGIKTKHAREPLSICFESTAMGTCGLPMMVAFIYRDDPNDYRLSLSCALGHIPHFLFVSKELGNRTERLRNE